MSRDQNARRRNCLHNCTQKVAPTLKIFYVKQSVYKPGEALRVPEGGGSQNFPQRDIPGIHFF